LRSFREASSEISLEAALKFLNDDDALYSCILNGVYGFNRGLVRRKDLQDNPDIAEFLRKVLASSRSEDRWQSNPALNACYRRGWLQAELSAEEDTVYVFASMLHRKYSFPSLMANIAIN
jgi:hypothetical protein